MRDYEWMILERQESESDDCHGCPYASPQLCNNQCMESVPTREPLIPRKENTK